MKLAARWFTVAGTAVVDVDVVVVAEAVARKYLWN